jgi:hypothetical protein
MPSKILAFFTKLLLKVKIAPRRAVELQIAKAGLRRNEFRVKVRTQVAKRLRVVHLGLASSPFAAEPRDA